MTRLFTSLFVSVTLLSASGTFVAQASDVVADRKSNFKNSAGIMRGMRGHIGSSDFAAIETGALSIAAWAEQMTDYFPEGSMSTGAKPAIWDEFERFSLLASEHHKAALALAAAAESEDISAVTTAVQALGGTCQTCHSSYKN